MGVRGCPGGGGQLGVCLVTPAGGTEKGHRWISVVPPTERSIASFASKINHTFFVVRKHKNEIPYLAGNVWQCE